MKNFMLLLFLSYSLAVFSQTMPEQVGQEQQMKLLQVEKVNSKKLLLSEGFKGEWHLKMPLMKRDGYDITGNVRNTGKLAQFKDIRVRITWYSDTNTLLKSEDFVSYQLVNPGATVRVSIHANPPAGYNKVFQVEILGATSTS